VVSGPDSTGAGILDAAMRVLVDIGFRRATVELTAKYAGLSHMTISRRWPTKAELFRTAVRREFTVVVTEAFDTAAAQDSFDDVVLSAFSGIVWAVHNHPLMVRESSTEPEFVLPTLTTESGPVMDAVVELVAERLRVAAVTTDRVLADPEALADTFVRVAQALLLVPDPVRPMTSRADVESYARRYLLPLAQSTAARRSDTLATAQLPSIRASTARKSGRRRPFELVPPLVLALLLGSGALATAIVQPWSAPVTATTVNDSGPTPPLSPTGETVTLAPSESGISIRQTSPTAAPPPPPPVAPVAAPTTMPQAIPPTVHVQQPAGTRASSADDRHVGPAQGAQPPQQPKPGPRPSAPPGPGASHQPVRPPGPGGGQPGSGRHPGGPGGGPA
jgi:AcrR family transcriptional regulator